jgi:glycosyltransferase involved in cell wall biosynthesis
MNLLFVHGGSRLKFDEEGFCYVDGNLNNNIFDRYSKLCDKFILVLRKENTIYKHDYAVKSFNKVDLDKTELFAIDDLYRPFINYINIPKRSHAERQIEKAVLSCDKAIIRSLVNFYTVTTLKYCQKYNKPYLVEVTGCVYEGFWFHSLRGKLIANYYENRVKKMLKVSPYAVYVTEEALQKRYPCNGYTLGCSDVEISEIPEILLKERVQRYSKDNKKFIIGTAAFLAVKWKGQDSVIKAIAKLKEKGIHNIEYQLVGAGDCHRLLRAIKKYKLEDCVKILGAKPHEEVFTWIDTLDVYIQPSYQEGLCRTIVEAMSRSCPVVSSNAGGNYELTNPDYIFQKGDEDDIMKVLTKILDINNLISECHRSFSCSHRYLKSSLDKKRNSFYQLFISK